MARLAMSLLIGQFRLIHTTPTELTLFQSNDTKTYEQTEYSSQAISAIQLDYTIHTKGIYRQMVISTEAKVKHAYEQRKGTITLITKIVCSWCSCTK